MKKKFESWEKCGEKKEKSWKKHGMNGGFCGGAFYFLGFLGAAVYYIGSAETFGVGFIGFLKAIVWPAFLVFHLMQFLYGG